MTRDSAFLLLAKAAPLTGHPLLLEDLSARGLAPLVITEAPPTGVPGLREVAVIDSTQHVAIARQAAAWALDYDIRGTMCLGEIFVEAMGVLGDMLGLPHPGLRATRVCRDKLLQRLYLRDWSPRCQVIAPEQRRRFEGDFSDGPAILKPTGRFASSGVQEVADSAELTARFAEYGADEVLLLEHKVVGREVSVESLVQDGRIVFDGITEKATNAGDGRFFVEMAHTVPCTNLTPREVAGVLATNAQILDRLQFENGIAHAEYRVTDDGDVFLMEVACRAPGDALMAVYQLATLRPVELALIKCALGERVAYPRPVRFARQVYLPQAAGTLIDVEIAEDLGVRPYWVSEHGRWPTVEAGSATDPPRLRHVLVLKQRGVQLSEIRDSFDRAVTFLIDAPTLDELDRFERYVRRSIRIVTSHGVVAHPVGAELRPADGRSR